MQFTATQVLHDKLQQLKDLMRHQVPDGDLCAIVERAADLLISQQVKRRFAQTEKPRSAAPEAGRKAKPWSRYVPRAVVREVYSRDGGQCTFVSSDGRRCGAHDHIELHHEDPFALGGLPTVENLQLLCRSHNALLAEWDFGRAHVQGKRREASARNCDQR
ncbi:MAG TPA: HNH endonuclease signature motif containing protein [Polyangiales bacterium]|nr:HNH endonuclease signature motif containing protein [Polyangiales bacterium]